MVAARKDRLLEAWFTVRQPRRDPWEGQPALGRTIQRGEAFQLRRKMDTFAEQIAAEQGIQPADIVVVNFAEAIESRADYRLVESPSASPARLRQQIAGNVFTHRLVMKSSSPPLSPPPESMRPDRAEVMNEVAAAPRSEIASGVRFESLVGGHNGARRLTTGLVTFVPGAGLPYHTHPFSDSITLLRRKGTVEVEGRCYELGLLDNIVILREIAHAARNLSAQEPAVLHIAMASDHPTRVLVEKPFLLQRMPSAAQGWVLSKSTVFMPPCVLRSGRTRSSSTSSMRSFCPAWR